MAVAKNIPQSPSLLIHLLPKEAPTLINVVHNRRARRYLLKIGRDGHPRLTIPLRGSRTEAVNFLNRNLPWLQKALLEWKIRRAKRSPTWEDGSHFLFRGEEVTLQVRPYLNHVVLSFGKEVIGPIPSEQNYRATIKAHLRDLATTELPARTMQLAARHAIKISRVTIRAQKTRWGSCSCKGAISLNWHLIQTPAFVVDYIIIHELMHRRQMNHSAKFWNEVERACPNYRLAEKWLKDARLDLTS